MHLTKWFVQRTCRLETKGRPSVRQHGAEAPLACSKSITNHWLIVDIWLHRCGNISTNNSMEQKPGREFRHATRKFSTLFLISVAWSPVWLGYSSNPSNKLASHEICHSYMVYFLFIFISPNKLHSQQSTLTIQEQMKEKSGHGRF